MSILLLSPHRDDAAFSCGLLLAWLVRGRIPLQIVNVCTISDYAPYATLHADANPVAEITRLRAAEDTRFVQQLENHFSGAHPRVQLFDLGWRDAPLRHGIATEEVLAGGATRPDEMAHLAAVFRSFSPASIVLAPLALGGHLDHRLVRDAAVDAWSQRELVFYEDLPYACRMSSKERAEQTERALPWTCERAKPYPAQPGDKRHMALCYPSQIAAAVADEMESYGAALSWTERLYGAQDAVHTLASLSGSLKMVEDSRN